MRLLEVNAHFMPAVKFNQLVENLKADGVMTSTPLLHENVVVSGNHRVQAGIKAGIEDAEFIEVLGVEGPDGATVSITRERLIAIQLSHNALVGEDDPNVLRVLYEDLALPLKAYSGITDEMLGAEQLDLSSLSAGGVQYQEVMLTFLPNDAAEFAALLERMQALGARGGRMLVYAAAVEDWGKMFDAVVAVKEQLNIRNTAIAFRIMAELAVQKLEELAGEK